MPSNLHSKWKALALTVLVAAFLPLAAAAQGSFLRIYYPDIEQGSSTLVVSPTGSALLVDGGSGLNPADDDLVEFIRDLIDQGVVSSLDYVVATHYDEDHIGRLEDVLNFGVAPPTTVVYDRGTDGGVPETFAYSDYAFAAAQKTRMTITANTDINLGGGVVVSCYVVNAELPNATSVDLTGTSQQENARSVGLVVHYGDFQAWIGGDLTGNPSFGVADVESPASAFAGDVDVYTFNHHGSRSSSNATFLGVLKAEVGIVQSSASNTFGHPSTEVVDRFLNTLDTAGNTPLLYQQNPGNPTDDRSDDGFADGIADPDDLDEAFGLPGTLTLLSDGTSYRFFGGEITPFTLPADSGLGTLGNYPPSIPFVSRNPLVPTAAGTVTVTARVYDEAAVSPVIEYDVDGVAQTPVAMSQTPGTQTFTGVIPAQGDGARVSFRVAATDGLSQTARSHAQGYYSGVTPISTFRINDAGGVLVPMRYAVRVEGNLTAEPSVFHAFVAQMWVEDATGGVQVFDRTQAALDRGDLVQFVGSLEQFSGQTQINVSQPWGNFGVTDLGPGSAPAPQVVTVSQVDESLEGSLIRINDVTVVSGEIAGSGSSNLTITDDAGLHTLTLRIDEDTDLPGASTPTQPFDVIGIAAQFDSFHPYTFGYQILPRGREDVLSDEVNHPDVLISEIHADPHATEGDANGDGAVSSTQDEFIELLNTSWSAVDLSGYTLADGVGVRHVFPPGTVVPAREAVVVFSGGTPTGSFGNAAANGLVFTASTGSLGLNNGGDTLTLATDLAVVVQTVVYGSEGGQDQSLVRPDYTNAPFALHTVADAGGRRYSPGTRLDGSLFTIPAGAVLLSEVLYDPTGSDGGLEWVELFNTTASPIDLATMSLGQGGGDYTTSLVQLSGVIAPGETFVVGGPDSSAANANPTFDLAVDFSPDFQNSGTTADGVALFNVPAAQVDAATVPVDAVRYGTSNDSGLIDENGVAGAPEVGDAPSGSSVERTDLGGTWQIQATPTPGTSPLGSIPPPVEQILLSEVYYDAPSGDNGLEWIELFNAGAAAVDLSGYSLGAGGTVYDVIVQLSGTLDPGETFVVGGPTSNGDNANPVFDQVVNFSPDLQNSGTEGDGVALFDVPAVSVTPSTVPVDAVVYGPNNANGLIDETGSANAPEVGDAPAGSSIERTTLGGSWQIQAAPTPNASPL